MAVALRLARQGSKKKPFYRVVAADKRAPRDGRFIEQIGYYDPRRKIIRVDSERYQHWVERGAQASETVASLVRRVVKQGGGSEPVSL
jgi:small subunit ribosomal protein S16